MARGTYSQWFHVQQAVQSGFNILIWLVDKLTPAAGPDEESNVKTIHLEAPAFHQGTSHEEHKAVMFPSHWENSQTGKKSAFYFATNSVQEAACWSAANKSVKLQTLWLNYVLGAAGG